MFERIRASKITGVHTINHIAPRQQQMRNRCHYGLSMAISGKIVYHHRGQDFVSDKNTVVILPMGADYDYECVEPGTFMLINFLPAEDWGFDTFYTAPIKDRAGLILLHEAITKSSMTEGAGRETALLSHFYAILSFLCSDAVSDGVSPLVKDAKRYIEENLSLRELQNTDIAEHLGISEVYLRKLFTLHVGVSPKKYIQDARISLSKRHLCESDMSVTEISEAVGYTDVYTFCHAFKKMTAMTPREYRKQMRRI
ncbi:MAG: helix-turn-helix transcriptional regulator [Clostridia bacterium]|nr:helix-turn-helix transcriptional regulator [Clostridia bacterium]